MQLVATTAGTMAGFTVSSYKSAGVVSKACSLCSKKTATCEAVLARASDHELAVGLRSMPL